MILHSKQKTLPRSFIQVVQSLKPTKCSCVLAGCMILMFSKFLNSQCFYHTRRCPKNWPPLYTFKSSTVGSQTMQPFSCCIIKQITLETSKKCINNFVFCLFLCSKDDVRCHATPLLVFSHLLAVHCNWFYQMVRTSFKNTAVNFKCPAQTTKLSFWTYEKHWSQILSCGVVSESFHWNFRRKQKNLFDNCYYQKKYFCRKPLEWVGLFVWLKLGLQVSKNPRH